MAGLHFGENVKFFCARLARARAVRAGGGEGRLGQCESQVGGGRSLCRTNNVIWIMRRHHPVRRTKHGVGKGTQRA